MSPERLVFIDETGATTDMARRYGRSSKGMRLVAAVPHGHWKTTFLAALRHDRIPPLVRSTVRSTVNASSPTSSRPWRRSWPAVTS
jgi:hypothetical protein